MYDCHSSVSWLLLDELLYLQENARVFPCHNLHLHTDSGAFSKIRWGNCTYKPISQSIIFPPITYTIMVYPLIKFPVRAAIYQSCLISSSLISPGLFVSIFVWCGIFPIQSIKWLQWWSSYSFYHHCSGVQCWRCKGLFLNLIVILHNILLLI